MKEMRGKGAKTERIKRELKSIYDKDFEVCVPDRRLSMPAQSRESGDEYRLIFRLIQHHMPLRRSRSKLARQFRLEPFQLSAAFLGRTIQLFVKFVHDVLFDQVRQHLVSAFFRLFPVVPVRVLLRNLRF